MPVKIRLMRIGAKKRPFYRVVAVDERKKRTGEYIELLGTYNPLTEPKEIILKQDKIDAWIKNGAVMSDGFLRIIKQAPQKPARPPKKEKKGNGAQPAQPAPAESKAQPAEQPETPAEPVSTEVEETKAELSTENPTQPETTEETSTTEETAAAEQAEAVDKEKEGDK